MLGSLCFQLSRSRGRRFPELPHPYRNDFQRDRDRIIHARAFRRMEGKTQVFAPNLSDHFRNRLTHTLEVAQIARTVASVLELNEEFTETLALAHDLGHPPFGHAGEHELDQRMRQYGDFFEHNLHSLRIVDVLERRYARFDGLNLTFEVREGILKHSREVDPGNASGLEEFLPGLRPPLEAQLVDLADAIAYSTADLDDGFSAGLLTLDQAAAAIPLIGLLSEQITGQFPGAIEKTRFREVLRSLINEMVGGLIQGTVDCARASGARDVEELRLLDHRVAAFTPATRALAGELKRFLVETVYQSPSLADERVRVAAQLGDAFDFLAARGDRLPQDVQIEGEHLPTYRVVCDYLAGMTDSYFLRYASSLGL
jgi:dGTPase